MVRPNEVVGSSGQIDKAVVLFVASVANFLQPFLASSINVAIPSIGREFAIDAVTLSWVAMAPILAAAVFTVPFGKVADIHGRKKAFLVGVAGFTVASLLCGLATSGILLIVFQALLGIANAMLFATSMAILTSVYPPRERGRALGIAVAAVYIGLSVGPAVGGFLTQQLSWRGIFFLCAILGAVVVSLIVTKMRAEWAEARGQKLDLIGSVIYGLTLLTAIYGLSALPAMTGAWLIVVGVVCLIGFLVWENRVANPVLDVGLFRHNMVFSLSSLSALIHYASTSALTFMLSLYLQYVKGLSPQLAGFVLLSMPAMMVIFSPIAGWLSDRIEPRIIASLGMALTATGLALIALLSDASSIEYILVALMIGGLGFALFSSPNTNAIMGSVDKRFLGVASATTSVMRLIGQMLSMGVATLIISVYVGSVQMTPQHHASFASGFRLAFIIFATLCLIGVFTSLARGNLRGEATVGSPRGRRPPAGN